MNDVQRGALAGLIATAPMTWLMEALHQQLPVYERYPLPPRQIMMRMARKLGAKQDLDHNERLALTLISHLLVGTSAGAIYGSMGRRLKLPYLATGAAFGMAVWAGNYMGLLPALGLLKRADKHPKRRTGLMIAAHLLYGTVTAVLTEQMRREAEEQRSTVAPGL